MPIRRVAVIFDDQIRPDTAGVYVRQALAGLVEVVHFRPEWADAIPRTGFDLYLNIDDDTEHRLTPELHPRAYWAIDTHRDFAARLRRSAECDLVFAAQRDGAERLRDAGIDSAIWLPLACDPAIHRKHDVPRQYDVAFVGHIFPGPRDELLQRIAREFPGHFIGRAFFDEMARIYSASQIVFNRSLRNDVNMRVFEALACGSLLVTNDLAGNGQDELFHDRVHLATYREPGEMLEIIAYYLGHPKEREAIAAAGRAEAVGRHTYRHRMERLLAEAERRLARRGMTHPGAAQPQTIKEYLPQRHRDHREESFDAVAVSITPCSLGGYGIAHGVQDSRSESDREKCLDRSGPRSGEVADGSLPDGPGRAVAESRSPAAPGLASIIVPCWNQLAFTRLCLQGLFRSTRAGSWELIVVDNGSTDDTAAYLAGVQDASAVPITVITNPQNVGFPAAVNQGLQAASGEYLVLLNNDAVVTEGWLEHLVALTAARLETTNGEGGESSQGLLNTKCTKDTKGRVENGRADPVAGQPVIGLVGPMSNYATPPQLVEEVPYRDLDEMHAFAGRWRDEHRGQWSIAGKLSGFCLLMTRAAYQAVGGLDERFGLGFFDDDDLAVRARRAGFELAVARDVFVHHFGSRTFVGNGVDAERLLEENARRFAEKWGHDAPPGRRVTLRNWRSPDRPPIGEGEACCPQMDADERRWEENTATPRMPDSRVRNVDVSPPGANSDARGASALSGSTAPSSHLRPSASICGQESSARLQGPRPKVSLTLIVRDEQKNLPQCLASVRGVFDEIVVVDTGSVDRTREVAREHGASVFEFAWIDDFAAARNAALGHATGDYAFWLDADDVVEPGQRGTLRAMLDGLRVGDEAAYVVRCACDPGADGSGGETVVDHIRLFPLRPDIRWTYRVHEQIMPALRRAGIPVRWTDLVVRHTGYVDVALRSRKLQRDTRILLEELRDRPDEPFILFNLGAIAIEQKDWEGALAYLGKSLAHSAPSDSITRKLFALIARAHQMRGDSEAALRVCAEGLALEPEDAELLFRKAVLHRHRGEPGEAEACWRTILKLARPERFASVDMGIYGHLTRRNLAVLAAERGDREEEEGLWRAVLAECPGDREALGRLECPVAAASTRPPPDSSSRPTRAINPPR